jgi:hypothetical protein
MKKLNKVAMLFATAGICCCCWALRCRCPTIDNWRASDGTVWKNGTNELCWRDANWTPSNRSRNLRRRHRAQASSCTCSSTGARTSSCRRARHRLQHRARTSSCTGSCCQGDLRC